MIRILLFFILFAPLPLTAQFQDGDIVFTKAPLSDKSIMKQAIRAATGTEWTHVGVIYLRNGKPMVLEAVQPIQLIPLTRYLARKGTHVFKRLKDTSKINSNSTSKAMTFARRHLKGKYDGKFQWSNSRLYCSELVWKIYYYSAGIKLCKIRRYKSYNLAHPFVKKLIIAKYGSMKRINLNEKVVAPSDIYASSLLKEIHPLAKKTATQHQ